MRRALIGLLLSLFALAPAACAQQTPPLLTYVGAEDTSYAWTKDADAPPMPGSTVMKVRMTSQTWQGIPWQHVLWVIRPEKVRENPAVLLMVTGGRGEKPSSEMALIAATAGAHGIPVAVLYGIPNQPLFGGKREDALIAHTFVECMKTGDLSWPLLFPMVKSVVRAMDTIQEVAEKEWKAPVKGFVVSGASKRGWTSWLTGAADPRVLGIAPMVYDNLNLGPQMRQQLACYGAYSEQIRDYTELGIQQVLETPQGKALAAAVDPYALRDRLKIPKLMVNGTNDPYWTLEAARLYFDDLAGEKHLLYVPNTGHGLGDFGDVIASILALTRACEEGRKLPEVKWTYREEAGGLRLTVATAEKPVKVAFWTAESPTLDFRGAKWQEQPMSGDKAEFLLEKPKEGHRAFFGQVRVRSGAIEFPLSTAPRIVSAK